MSDWTKDRQAHSATDTAIRCAAYEEAAAIIVELARKMVRRHGGQHYGPNYLASVWASAIRDRAKDLG